MGIFRKRKKGSGEELRDLLGGYELPSFPAVVMNVLSMLRDQESSMTVIAQQLQRDPGMLIKVLRTVNAAAFGLKTRVSNIDHAVTLLGRYRLEAIILSHAVKDTLPAVKLPWFDMKRFWLSASRRASLARLLALQLHPATHVESFTAGLLQDMAVQVLANVKNKEYCDILEQWNTQKDTWLHNLEREAFSYDHSTVGGLIAKEWDLSEQLVQAISWHHSSVEEYNIGPAVRLVSYIRDSDRADGTDILVKTCQEVFGIAQETVSEMKNKAFEDAEELSHMLN